MRVIIKHASEIARGEAHNGAGSRRIYIEDKQTPSRRIQGMAYGWLPAGQEHEFIFVRMYE